jgi:hypothetical protein
MTKPTSNRSSWWKQLSEQSKTTLIAAVIAGFLAIIGGIITTLLSNGNSNGPASSPGTNQPTSVPTSRAHQSSLRTARPTTKPPHSQGPTVQPSATQGPTVRPSVNQTAPSGQPGYPLLWNTSFTVDQQGVVFQNNGPIQAGESLYGNPNLQYRANRNALFGASTAGWATYSYLSSYQPNNTPGPTDCLVDVGNPSTSAVGSYTSVGDRYCYVQSTADDFSSINLIIYIQVTAVAADSVTVNGWAWSWSGSIYG